MTSEQDARVTRKLRTANYKDHEHRVRNSNLTVCRPRFAVHQLKASNLHPYRRKFP